MLKSALDFLNVLKHDSFKICSLKVSWGTKKWFFNGIIAKTSFPSLHFEECSIHRICTIFFSKNVSHKEEVKLRKSFK